MAYPISDIRDAFPITNRTIGETPLVYLDNAATTQKPQCMIDALVDYYSRYNSNVHRGVHTLSQEATNAFEQTRREVRDWLCAEREEEIIFTGGATDSLNMLASIIGKGKLQKGDRVFLPQSEHHSNIVPWQFLKEEKGIELVEIPFDTDTHHLDKVAFSKALEEGGCALLVMASITNALGSAHDISYFIEKVKQQGALVILDASQSAAHEVIDVRKLGCDFLTFSTHKVYGPTGLGILYGRYDLLSDLPPYRGGGEMIETVGMQSSTYAGLPHKLEAGTPNIADVIAFGATVRYLKSIGISEIARWEHELVDYAAAQLEKELPDLRILGYKKGKNSALSIVHPTVHAFDIGAILDQFGVAVRTGNHCAQPLMARYGISGTLRASFAMYNTREEVDLLIHGLKKAIQLLA